MFTAISSIVIPINIYTNDTSNPILKVVYKDGTFKYEKSGHSLIHLILVILTTV